MTRLRSSITLLLAILVITSTLVAILGPGTTVSNALKIEGASYSVWLTPCTCYGGTLRIAWPSEPPTLNWWVAGSTWDLTALDVIYDRPVRVINGTLTFEAVEWMEYSSDYKILTIGVRKGIKFHDGVELTAEDLAFTINVLATKSWTYYYGYFRSVDRAEAADKYTVKVYFKSPDAQFILNSLNALRIMPKHIWEPLLNSLGDELAKYSPKPGDLIGSGPFKFVDRVPGQYLKFAANKDYWLGRPCIDELILIPMTDVSVIILGLQKGELDAYAWGVEAPVVPKLLATPNVAIHVYASEYFYHWGLNNEVWPLNISKFRLALSYAIDKQSIINDVLLGYGMPGSPGVVGPIGSSTPWYNPNVEKLVYFNRSKAAEILDEIGFKDVNGDGFREGPKG
ncbi:MAG: ABC transporter substrate-binding protein, partial [Zestosphaera sp.]